MYLANSYVHNIKYLIPYLQEINFTMDGLQGYHDQTRTGFSGAFDADLPCIGMRLETKADLEQLRQFAKMKKEWQEQATKRCKRV